MKRSRFPLAELLSLCSSLTDMKKAFKIIGIVFAVVLVIVLSYLVYVVLDYSRIEDNQALQPTNVNENDVPVGEQIRVMSLNFGFGAYSSDYSFFMDGGVYSRAYSEDEVMKNLSSAIEDIKEINADIIALQEVDIDGTRSYHVDQMKLFSESLGSYNSVSAVNYDSSYLFYPFDEPHGANKSGIMTFSKYAIGSAVRRSLPVENSLMKFLDLDRCYSKSFTSTENGKKLCIYNLHLSAYTSDGTIATAQLKMLIDDMYSEYENGNYCIALGDFNMDLLEDSSQYFITIESHEDYNWAKPFDLSLIDGKLSLFASYNLPSCRNADRPYDGEGSCFVLTVDGMLCTQNISVMQMFTYNADFEYSDHQPVVFDIILEEN